MKCPLIFATFILTTLAAAPAAAQNYPDKPVRLVVPFPAGGGTDTLARQLAKDLGQRWNQPIVVENKPGAGGAIGAAAVAAAKADGYMLLMTTAGVSSINPSLYKSLPYDPVAQFAPISRVASTVFGVLVHPSLPVNSITDLIALAKAKPGTLTFGSAGNGAAGHLPGELFKTMAGIDIRHVPYRGTTPALNDLLGGQISMMFAILGPAMQHVQAGKLKLLATTGPQRSASFPQVPTVAEAGVPGYSADEWWGVAAPIVTPAPVVQQWNNAMRAYVQSAEKQLIQNGYEPASDSTEGFTALIKADRVKWGEVIRKADIQVD